MSDIASAAGYEAAIDRFTDDARAFCTWIETGAMDADDAVSRAMRHLAALYGGALLLPGVDASYLPWPPEVACLDVAAKRAVEARLRKFPVQFYWEVFHALVADAEAPCLGDLTDDLLDTYCDLKEGLLALEQGHRILAVWHWTTTFGFHWGRHATSALKAMHEFDPGAAGNPGSLT